MLRPPHTDMVFNYKEQPCKLRGYLILNAHNQLNSCKVVPLHDELHYKEMAPIYEQKYHKFIGFMLNGNTCFNTIRFFYYNYLKRQHTTLNEIRI